jgi:hypothetical protein
MSLTVNRPTARAKSWRTRWTHEESIVEKTQADPSPRSRGSVSVSYEPLYRYLENRFANTVVLTFAEIEDLLGFTLPSEARADRAWWTSDDANETQGTQSRSWTRADRSAVPNLDARTVIFERAQR